MFSSWDKRREYIRMIKADRRRKDLPKLKDKSHLMSFPVQESDGELNKITLFFSIYYKFMRCLLIVSAGFLSNLVYKVYLRLKHC